MKFTDDIMWKTNWIEDEILLFKTCAVITELANDILYTIPKSNRLEYMLIGKS